MLNGLQVDLPENYVHHQDNDKPEFRAKFPHGKIPALDGADGFKLFETTAIARYSESTAYLPLLSLSQFLCQLHDPRPIHSRLAPI